MRIHGKEGVVACDIWVVEYEEHRRRFLADAVDFDKMAESIAGGHCKKRRGVHSAELVPDVSEQPDYPLCPSLGHPRWTNELGETLNRHLFDIIPAIYRFS